MRHLQLFTLLLCFSHGMAQVKIHAHNDYEKPLPLVNAVKQKVFSVEADVYPVDDNLLVAHHKTDIDPRHTLNGLYLWKIDSLFDQNKGSLTADTAYRLALVIDVKENFENVLGQLIKLLEPKLELFDRRLNPKAVQIIISGDRGPIQKWSSYPAFIYFDGRPAERYDNSTLERVAMISDSYARYAGDESKIMNVVSAVHELGKPLRFWGAPDDQPTWKYLHSKGVDIINSDRVEECSLFFKSLIPSGK